MRLKLLGTYMIEAIFIFDSCQSDVFIYLIIQFSYRIRATSTLPTSGLKGGSYR